MTTYIDFAPSPTAAPPFQFQATLDGEIYNVTTTWNLFGVRWYVNIFGVDGTLIVSTALTGSPSGINFQSLTWANGQAIVTTTGPHGYRIGSLIELTISGCSPDAYNGQFQVLATGDSTFTYPLIANPGNATAIGMATYDVNLVGGYFQNSSLVYRVPANQFEVSP